MAKFTAYVHTNKVGSDCKVSFEIYDEDLEELTDEERNKLIDECAQDALAGAYEWGWTEDED
jgi:hypothetical protein